VLAVVSDRRLANNEPDIVSVTDYYPFGMGMPGRQNSAENYRYGFNAAEKIDEYSGLGNTYDLGARIYNPRLGKMFSPDPREKEYPWQTTYAYYANSPIWQIDYNGEGGNMSTGTPADGNTTAQSTTYRPQRTIPILRVSSQQNVSQQNIEIHTMVMELCIMAPTESESDRSMWSDLWNILKDGLHIWGNSPDGAHSPGRKSDRAGGSIHLGDILEFMNILTTYRTVLERKLDLSSSSGMDFIDKYDEVIKALEEKVKTSTQNNSSLQEDVAKPIIDISDRVHYTPFPPFTPTSHNDDE